MKAYGIPRIPDAERKHADGFSIWLFAHKGSRIFNKKSTRRIWKKRIRAILKRELENE